MEFENFSSVNAKTRRSTPVEMRASTWAFTFSTPASALDEIRKPMVVVLLKGPVVVMGMIIRRSLTPLNYSSVN